MDAPAIDIAGRAHLNGSVLFGPVDLTIGAAEWTCLLGPSGIGKSTILRLIAGLQTGADFDGTIAATDGAALPGRSAYMAQDDLLMPWLDVLGNVLLGSRLRGMPGQRDRAMDLIGRVGLADHVAKRPRHLSGGMRQRAALARTLMEDRPVILLDEPFSALDARTRAEMQELAAELLTGRTVLLVTHDPPEAARLGHAIWVMTETGFTPFDAPASHPVRDHSDPATFACEAALMSLLRRPAA